MLSQCGVRKRSDILSRLAQGISLSLGKQNGRLAERSPPAQFVHRLNLFQTSGLRDVHLDTGQGQLGKKGAPKKRDHTSKPKTAIEGKIYCLEKTQLCFIHLVHEIHFMTD